MLASLRNNFSNYRTCLLRFDIEENIIIEAFTSLRFASITLTFAFNVFEKRLPYQRRLPVSVIRGVDSKYALIALVPVD